MSADRIRQHLAEAQRAGQSGLRDEARRLFEAVLSMDEGEPTARNWLGADALARSDAGTAAMHFEIACRGEPGQRSHWLNLAAARRTLGDSERERAALEKALAIDQTDLLALVRIAELHERLGEKTPAAERWTAVLALSSGINNPTQEFAAILGHARQYVEDQQRTLVDAVDTALAGELAVATAPDERRMRAAADAWLGRRPIYTNQCEGLHYPFLPADEFFDREHFPWLDQLEAATGMILAELNAILADPGPGLTPYISLPPGVPANKWSGLDKSLDWGAFHLWKEGERFDEACDRAPRTAALLDSLPICQIKGRAPNVFFSILKAGSHIPAHTGVTNVRSVVHLPLIVPQGCEFRVGGETRSWVEGSAFAFDDTIEHEAWNRSDRDRAVLIIDVWNPYLSEHERAMICRLYEAADTHRA
ncbi:aspartyl/asparaginyl beta-hydroxylase domain-containing protein [Sphingomonas hankyongi]|uniref:Aspartyl/asparaginyl beta-hydroxylase domain-containing protein n=1 Tax=Sphingomonas hankyongi TaxID=2908209 RepID=A0ABT0S0P2_9SPHN|nr:aspartyl/asparaginyl beta-hydroxylase domain-containing protein [Sphingomonas hankyongi]MCL6729201.1 aspartyl/asparaginyl beta-hydroxylase domain-containing protein [Sphingomonas hankyongi]